jgi:hypothetical protein
MAAVEEFEPSALADSSAPRYSKINRSCPVVAAGGVIVTVFSPALQFGAYQIERRGVEALRAVTICDQLLFNESEITGIFVLVSSSSLAIATSVLPATFGSRKVQDWEAWELVDPPALFFCAIAMSIFFSSFFPGWEV